MKIALLQYCTGINLLAIMHMICYRRSELYDVVTAKLQQLLL